MASFRTFSLERWPRSIIRAPVSRQNCTEFTESAALSAACRQHSKSGASLTSGAKKPSYPSFRGERPGRVALVDGLSIVKSTREFALATRTQFRFLLLFFPPFSRRKRKCLTCTREFQKRIRFAWTEIVDLNNIGEREKKNT